jgi:hypothetical protein
MSTELRFVQGRGRFIDDFDDLAIYSLQCLRIVMMVAPEENSVCLFFNGCSDD